MRIKLTLIFLFIVIGSLNAQNEFVDVNMQYESNKTGVFIDSVAYTNLHTIFYIRITPKAGELITFSGAFTSYTWNLVNVNNRLQVSNLQLIQNLRKNGLLIAGKEQINPAEQYYEEADAEVYTAECVYAKLPFDVRQVHILQGMMYNESNLIIKNISIQSKYGNIENQPELQDINELSDSIINETPLAQAEAMLELALDYQQQNKLTKSLEAINEAFSKIDSSANSELYSTLLLNKGNIEFYQGNWKLALSSYQKSLSIEKNKQNSSNLPILYNNIASVYDSKLMFDEALYNYQKALNIYKNQNKEEEQAQLNYNIGNLYYSTEDFDSALKFYNHALNLEDRLNNEEEKLLTYNNIGVIYYEKERWSDALQNYFRSLELARKHGYMKEQAITLNNIGNVKFDEKDYNQAVNYYNQSKELSLELKYLKGMAIALHNQANAYLKMGKIDTAKLLLSQSLQISQELDLNEVLFNNYRSLAEIFASADDCAKSLEYYKKYSELRFSVSEEKTRQISILHQKYKYKTQNLEDDYGLRMKSVLAKKAQVSRKLSRMVGRLKAERVISKYHKEKQKQEIDILNQENTISELKIREREQDLEKRNWQIAGLGSALLLGIVLVFLLIRLNKQSKRTNKLLAEHNSELAKQKEEIEKQRNRIEVHRNEIARQKESMTSSIVYARRIQQAVLPPTGYFNEFLPENFVFYRPRDIVSGDFYWISQQEQKIVIVAGDCTGHGVPGAFMSMLGISYLNRIVGEEPVSKASIILEKLRSLVISSLHQTGKMDEAKDGMDISLLVIDMENKTIDYAGAYNPLYLISNRDDYQSDIKIENNGLVLHEWKADKMPIGIHSGKVHEFTNNAIPYNEGDTLYLFSDGFVDQFGGESGRKYLSKRLKNFLLSINQQKMHEQQISVQNEFETWRGTREQIDDVIVIGFSLGIVPK